MIDFWEAIGRMAVHPELADDFLAALPAPHKIERETVGEQIGLDIPKDWYPQIQHFFSPVLSHGILSIMSAGESYWTFSFESTRRHMKEIGEHVKRTGTPHAPSTRYYVALGMIVIDKYLRKKIEDNEPVFHGKAQLPAPEKESILKMATQPEFNTLALGFCRLPWAGGNCNSTFALWDGHLHPLAVSGKYSDEAAA